MDRERRGESVKETEAIGDRVDRTARAIGDRHGDLAIGLVTVQHLKLQRAQ